MKTIITLFVGILTGILPVIYSNWINSGDLEYQVYLNDYDSKVGIINLNIENNSDKIEKNVEIRIPVEVKKDDVQIKSSLQGYTSNVLDKEIQISIPILRQKTVVDISILAISKEFSFIHFNPYLAKDITVTSDDSVGKSPSYLFTKEHKYDSLFILFITILSTFFVVLIIAGIIDYFTPYKNKLNSQFEQLDKLIQKNESQNTYTSFKTSIKKIRDKLCQSKA